MIRFLLASSLIILVATSVQADSDSPVPQAPTKQTIKWSLQVVKPRVAAGGLPNAAHQSEFVIRALDEKERPLAGETVELPHIWRDEVELGAVDPKHPEERMPRVEWLSSGKTVLTDAKGEAHGRFTSAEMMGHLTLHGPGDTTAEIEQIWNDDPNPYEGWEEGFVPGCPQKVPYKMSLRDGDKMLPIEGHHLKLLIDMVKLETYEWTGVLDENGDPKLEGDPVEWTLERPKENATSEEKARWEIISRWFHLQDYHEIKPGVYEGELTLPSLVDREDYAAFSNIIIQSVETFRTTAQDQDVAKDANS